MSDEAHIETAFRHRDRSRVEQWHGMAPDEEAMAHEEGDGNDADEFAFQFNAFLSYCFADARPAEWEAVAARALAIIRQECPEMVAQWPRVTVATGAVMWDVDGYAKISQAFRDRKDLFRRVLAHFFKEQREWLKCGVQNMYLVARHYRPRLVTNFDARDLTFTQLAVIFGEVPENATRKEQDRARARWSAKAQGLIRKPLERVGDAVPSLFGKSATVREKYRKAQQGNRNRVGRCAIREPGAGSPTR